LELQVPDALHWLTCVKISITWVWEQVKYGRLLSYVCFVCNPQLSYFNMFHSTYVHIDYHTYQKLQSSQKFIVNFINLNTCRYVHIYLCLLYLIKNWKISYMHTYVGRFAILNI
jgi:hypothetical protein